MLKRILRPRVLVVVGASLGLVVPVIVIGALVRTSSGSSATVLHTSRRAAATPTAPPTTTTTVPPPLQQPAPQLMPLLPPGGLGPGASGPTVQAYQQRFNDVHIDPGAIDGHYGQAMVYAAQTLEKLAGLPVTGRIGEAERNALALFRYPAPLQPDGGPNRTEVDVTKQVLTLYQNGQVRLLTTASTGAGELYCYDTPRDHPTVHICEHANTPSGHFAYREFRAGWDKSPLGRLYNPFYFHGGIAVHGYPQVPVTAASHGCVRIPMNIAEYFHTLVHVGDPVYVFGGKPAQVVSSTPLAPTTTSAPPAAPPVVPAAPPAPPATPPPTASTTTTTTPVTPPPA